jgi:hypothetical protein
VVRSESAVKSPTSKKLSFEVHRIERVGDLIVVGFDLSYRGAGASVFVASWYLLACTRWRQRTFASELLEWCGDLRTLRDLLETLISHDCDEVFRRSQANSRDLESVELGFGGVSAVSTISQAAPRKSWVGVFVVGN